MANYSFAYNIESILEFPAFTTDIENCYSLNSIVYSIIKSPSGGLPVYMSAINVQSRKVTI